MPPAVRSEHGFSQVPIMKALVSKPGGTNDAQDIPDYAVVCLHRCLWWIYDGLQGIGKNHGRCVIL